MKSLLDIIQSQHKLVFGQNILYTIYISQFAPNVLWKASLLFNLCKPTFNVLSSYIQLIQHQKRSNIHLLLTHVTCFGHHQEILQQYER